MFHVPEHLRVMGPKGEQCGAFLVRQHRDRIKRALPPLRVIAHDGRNEFGFEVWEHVSVSLPDRCPSWDDMCTVKDLFWDEEDCVMQLHPPASEYVNNHAFCLHLWRPAFVAIPTPPSIFVGHADLGTLERPR